MIICYKCMGSFRDHIKKDGKSMDIWIVVKQMILETITITNPEIMLRK